MGIVQERILQFREAKRKALVPHRRAKSKQVKDASRQSLREERQRIFQEAYHDRLENVGEIDALSSNTILAIDRAEVLYDPNLKPSSLLWNPKLPPSRGYQHPHLRRLFDLSLEEQITLMLSRKGRYKFFAKLPRPTPQPNCPHCLTAIQVRPLVAKRKSLREL